ncbi:MAG: hypothetical protein KGJ23_03620 [Euryarchaeota archaeon]|nr:hypothetical protein [Euryarchaeota archaeon]MDE1835689.1 hypothetical protein [Euryarchaeota archaeon]MDE1880449.1 hypothetical protein [Euryarchaeota archaeon]MDE2043879.1 hypothetical protein [Thermoplasmata archaeon]
MQTRAKLNRGTWWTLLGLLAVGLFMPLAAAAPAPAFHQPNPNNPPQVWAWGATFEKNDQGTLTGTGPTNNSWSLTYSIHEFLSWNTILTQTNTSNTSFTLQSQRAMAASFFLSAQGTNGPESATLNVTAQGWEKDAGSANFTTTGTVLLNGTTAVAAVAVENAQSTVSGNFTATSAAQLSGPQSGTFDGYASAAAQAQASIAFTPALGLFPMNVSTGSWWTSTSAYSAQGSYELACHVGYSASGQGGSMGGGANCGGNGSASGSGTVTLYGADHDLDSGVPGHLYHRIALAFSTGFGFEMRDGLLFVPVHADLYGGAGVASGAPGSPDAGAQMSPNYVDVDYHASHVGVVAANVQFAPHAAASMGMGTGVGMTAGSAPAATSTPASGLSSYAVQAQPESPAKASSANACLLGGAGCVAAKSGLFSPLLALIVIGVAVAVIVGAVMVSRGRRPKMPVGGYSSRPPSAFLMHNAPPAPAAPARPGTAPRPTGQQDPLGHLY